MNQKIGMFLIALGIFIFVAYLALKLLYTFFKKHKKAKEKVHKENKNNKVNSNNEIIIGDDYKKRLNEEREFTNEVDIIPPSYVFPKDTIYNVVKQYPFTLSFFVDKGMESITNEVFLNAFGKRTSLAEASKILKINEKRFLHDLNLYIHNHISENSEDESLDVIKTKHKRKHKSSKHRS